MNPCSQFTAWLRSLRRTAWLPVSLLAPLTAAAMVPAENSGPGPAVTVSPFDGAIDGELIVKWRPQSTVTQPPGARAHMPGAAVKYTFASLSRDWVALPPGVSLPEARAWYAAQPGVESVEPNVLLDVRWCGGSGVTPNDPRYPRQWHLPRIHAPEAWQTSTGSDSVVIAVMDTGIDYTHPDLAANIWTNSAEIPGNGLDDDQNGVVDDVHGIDVYSDDGDPMDQDGHGTAVAGVIGAVGNNSTGGSGVLWKVKLMALRIGTDDGFTTAAGLARAVDYAVTMKQRGVNVRVMNHSWGGGGTSAQFSLTVREAFGAAGAAGILHVCGSGNSHVSLDTQPFFPVCFDIPGLISVAASGFSDEPADFTNYGPLTCHLAAPGVAIESPMTGGSQAVQSGTSLATPMVSGAAGLLAALAPALTPLEIKDRLLDSVDASALWSGRTVTGGILNIARAVERLGRPVTSRYSSVPATAGRISCITRTAAGQGGNGSCGLSAVSDDGRFIAFVSQAGNLAPGCTGANAQILLRDRQAGTTVCITRSAAGVEGNGASDSPAMSADGRYIVFESTASNLTADDANGAVADIFLYDRTTGALTLFSRAPGGAANGACTAPAISGDGSTIAYASTATNLAGTDGNGDARDVFLQDRARLQPLRRVSVSLAGVAGNAESDRPALDADGSVVAFHSAATNLVAADTNNSYDIFVRDYGAGTLERANVTGTGAQSSVDAGNGFPSLSGDGRLVAFHSYASNLDAAHDPANWDIFLRDRQAGTTRLISTAVTQRRSGQGCSVTFTSDPAGGSSYNAKLSRDGRCVIYESLAWRLVPDDQNRTVSDIFLYDLSTSKTSLLSLSADGGHLENHSFWAAVSGDARYVTFVSPATDLVPGDGNGTYDIFLLDRGSVRPDLILADCTSVEAGRGVIGPPTGQRGLIPVTGGAVAAFLVRVENDGTAPASFRLFSTPGAGDATPWTAQFYDAASGGSLITASVTGSGGWLTPVVAPGARTTVRLEITAPSSGSGRSERIVNVTASAGGPVLDSVRAVAALPSRAGDLLLISRASDGQPANDSVKDPSFTADGRYVAWLSPATNLEPGEIRGFQDAFLYDRLTGGTTMLTARANGTPINGGASSVQLSRNGVYAVMATDSTDIITGDTNGRRDIYVKDLTTGNFERISAAPAAEGNGNASHPAISGDGRYVVFQSQSDNLTAAPDSNRFTDIFLRDRFTGVTQCLSLTTGGQAANAPSVEPQITPDGRYIAYTSFASNLASGDTNGFMDVFVFDRQTSTRLLVSRGLNGQSAPGLSVLTGISDDGRFVLFVSDAANLVAGLTTPAPAYLWDRTTGTVSAVDPRRPDMPSSAWIFPVSLSPDARWISFSSASSWLIPGDSGLTADVFIYDRVNASLTPVSVSPSGRAGGNDSIGGTFSADGRYFAFSSWASNLAGESGFPAGQLFLLDRGRFAPDALVRRPGGLDQGGNTTAPETQQVAYTTRAGLPAEFVITLRNTSALPDTLLATATTADPARWRVRWYETAGGTEITAAIIGAGWSSGSLAAGAARTLRVTVEPLTTGNAPLTLQLHSVSQGNTAAADTVFVTAEPDDDADTLPDSWERTWFASLTTASASTDTDRDTFSDAVECTAGTNPVSSASFPILTAATAPADGLTATWPAQPGRLYRLEYSPAPATPYTPVTGYLPATPPVQSVEFQRNNSAGFLRLTVERP